ncbi:HIS1 [Auxenochlorella protothecoides x Auxenochlorella symbiontica]
MMLQAPTSCGVQQRCLPSLCTFRSTDVTSCRYVRRMQSLRTTSRAHVTVVCSLNNSTVVQAPRPTTLQQRDNLRLALPSKGRMAEDTLQLLRDCQLTVVKPNPRQYVAEIAQMPGLEVWFQRATDVVRKLLYGDVDLGIVGADMVAEIGNDDPDLVVVHDGLSFGKCHLALGVPNTGKFAGVKSLDDLKRMYSSEQAPLRVVTGYHNVARKFFADNNFEHVKLLSADGALEAAPAMGFADIILDLVSSGVTLRENNLREVAGGRVMASQGVLVASRRALLERPGLLGLVHELLERLDAHLVADSYYSVVANMRGESAEAVAALLLGSKLLGGLEGPTISPVLTRGADGGPAQHGFYAAQVCVPKSLLYPAVKEIRKLGGSGVLVLPIMYIFDEEPHRWRALLDTLGLSRGDVAV